MHKVVSFLILLYAPSFLFGAPEAPQSEIITVHQNMWKALAKRDVDGWSAYVADDCIFSDEEGQVSTKAEMARHLRTLPQAYDRSDNHRDFAVRIHGNAAVLNFRLTVHEQFGNSDIVTEMRQTETFTRQRSSWKLIAVQWGALPINFRIPLGGEVEAIDEYAGDYEWRSGGPVDHIFARDGKLWSRLSEEPEDQQLLPSGRDAFFLRQDLGNTQFFRDAEGRVAGYVYRRSDGQEIRVKKIR